MEDGTRYVGSRHGPRAAKIAPAVALILTSRKRDVAMELPITELNATGGLKTLTDKLQSIFDVHGRDKSFNDYCAFESYHRKENQSMSDYVIVFERNYQRISSSDLKLPENILACKILFSARLDVKERQVVLLSTETFDLAKMKSTLLRISVKKL